MKYTENKTTMLGSDADNASTKESSQDSQTKQKDESGTTIEKKRRC